MTTRAQIRQQVGPLVREVGAAGAKAGLAGGVAMAFYLMLYAEFWGAGFLLPLRLIAATFFGVDGLIGGTGVVLIGLLLHLGISIVLGVVYALFPRRTTTTFHAMLGGIGFGVVVLLISTFLVLPAADPVLRARVSLFPMAWFLSHVIYGALTGGLVMPLRRKSTHVPLV